MAVEESTIMQWVKWNSLIFALFLKDADGTALSVDTKQYLLDQHCLLRYVYTNNYNGCCIFKIVLQIKMKGTDLELMQSASKPTGKKVHS